MNATDSNATNDAKSVEGGVAPDVSFIVCTYNVERFIEEAVRSALAQRDVTVEVIVVDDNSKDRTAAIVAELAEADSRVRLIRREENGGPSVARNMAMRAARGTWMAILDGDDTITPERSRRLIDIALATSADIVADNFERVEEDNTPTGSTMIPLEAAPYTLEVDIATLVERNIIFKKRKFTLGYLKSMFRTDFMRAHGLLHREDPLLMNEDYLLVLEALMAGARFIVTSESHYKWRMRRGSLSWRLKTANFDAMLAASGDMRLEERFASQTPIRSAVRRYDAAMRRGRDFCLVIEDAKGGHMGRAVGASLTRPTLWPLVGKYGLEAVKNRMGFKTR